VSPGRRSTIGVGVIGYGHWGPNLVRNFTELPNTHVAAVSDLRPERLALARQRYPNVETTRDHRELIANPRVDAVAIATPVATHYELGMRVLESGKHLLVEKPLAASAEAAVRLIDEANRRRLVLMVDHTYVYTPAVQKVKELVATNALGAIYYYDAVRVNLGLFQHDVNVLWDLAVHDLAILDHLLSCRPVAVSATGMSHVPGKPENVAYLTLFFDCQLIAHIHANWLAPIKVRRALIGGSRRMVMYDDLEPAEKVKVYDRGITLEGDPEALGEVLVGYRLGDMWAPNLDVTEALRTEALHFAQSIEEGTLVMTDGEAGMRVVRILEAAAQSLSECGRPVEVAGLRTV
jgi:predicted dehydrogenase